MLLKHRTDRRGRPLPAVDRGQLDDRIDATSREIGHLSRRLEQIRRARCTPPDHDEAATLRRHILARRQYLRQLETLRERARAW